MAADIDFSLLPGGVRGWRALIEQLKDIDQRAERHFLEFKSDVDLNTKAGRHKVAKFILGAANRDPAVAAPRFDGRALVIIGIEPGATPGVPGFELKDVEAEVTKFTGVPGPDWDVELIDVGDGKSVVVIVVGPPDPEQQPWVCESQGLENLHDGRSYIRVEGQTREANSAEQRLMRERSKAAAKPQVDLTVEVIGAAIYCTYDMAALDGYLEKKREWLLNTLPKPRRPMTLAERQALTGALGGLDMNAFLSQMGGASGFLGGSTPDPRSEEQYRAEVEAWAEAVRAALPGVVDQAGGRIQPAIKIRVRNNTEVYLDNPEFHIHIEGPVEAVGNETSLPNLLEELPQPPRRWGPTSNAAWLANNPIPGLDFYRSIDSFPSSSGPQHGMVRFENGGSVDLRFSLSDLRSSDAKDSDDDDLVLILRDPSVTELHGTWTARVRGHDALYTGDLTVAVDERHRDMTKWIVRQLSEDQNVLTDDAQDDGQA